MNKILGILFIGVFFSSQLCSQNKVHVSNIEQRNVDGHSIIFAEGKKLNGVVYENYTQKKLKYNVVDGKKNGPYELYYENGQLKRKANFKNDRYEGPFEQYWDNGQLEIKTSFKNNKYDGPIEVYFRNGQLEGKGFYEAGMYEGRIEKGRSFRVGGWT